MFRTRDFILYFSAIVFLLMAISVTLINQRQAALQADQTVTAVPVEIESVSATVVSKPTADMTRAERLAALKEKISAGELVDISAPEPEPLALDAVTPVEAPNDRAASAPGEVWLCADYTARPVLQWSAAEIQSQAVEGVRQYFEVVEVTVGTTSSTTLLKNVRVALPTKFAPFGQPSCIPQNVIGIALDNSLITNSETGLYSIFGSETVIGYALDGYPIYGLGTATTDTCGGRIEAGQYRYELAADRDTILNCFAGEPVTIK